MIFLPAIKALLLLSFYFFRTSGLMWCLDAKLSRVVHQKSQKTVNVWMICLQHLGQRGPKHCSRSSESSIAVAVQESCLEYVLIRVSESTELPNKQEDAADIYAGNEAARITFDFFFQSRDSYQILKWNERGICISWEYQRRAKMTLVQGNRDQTLFGCFRPPKLTAT